MNDHKKRKDLGIPPRWLYCPRKGSPIVGMYTDDVVIIINYYIIILFQR